MLAGLPTASRAKASLRWRRGVRHGEHARGGSRQHALFPALLAGRTLHVLRSEVTTEPARFAEYVAVHPLDVLKITPNHLLRSWRGRPVTQLAALLPRRWLVLGGEALRPDVARALLGARYVPRAQSLRADRDDGRRAARSK